MKNTIQKLRDNIDTYQQNPFSIKEPVISLLTRMMAGEDIEIDAANPFIYSIETTAAMVSASIDKADTGIRKLHPHAAMTRADLYPHMTEQEFEGVFSKPLEDVVISMLLPLQELIRAAKPIDNGGSKHIVIGGDSEYDIDGVKYYQHYPINILFQTNDSIQVTFDLLDESPLRPNESNVINWFRTMVDGVIYLNIEVPVSQVRMDVTVYDITNSTGLSATVPFKDQYYFTRAFTKFNNGTWIEIGVTYSDSIYDVTKPTVTVTVEDGFTQVSLPEIYITNGLVGGSLRLMTYSTQGEISVDYKTIADDVITVKWRDYNERTKPLSNLMSAVNSPLLYSDSVASGGSNGMSFDELRERVLYPTTVTRAPISFKELEARISGLGYTVTTLEKHVMGRRYLATRELALPVNGLFSSMNADLATIEIDKAATGYDLSILRNGKRTTLLPKAIYESDKGTTTLLTDAEVFYLNSLPKDTLLNELNSRNFLYTPFHIVMDESSNTFSVRSYQLNKPKVLKTDFIANNNVGYVVNTRGFEISLTDTGYRLVITASVPVDMDTVGLQLGFISRDNDITSYTEYVEGVITDKRAVFTVDIDTNFDIDIKDSITLTNLTNFSGDPLPSPMSLVCDLEMIYLRKGDSIPSEFDNLVSDQIIIGPFTALTRNIAAVELGVQLRNLYCEGRAVLVPPVYKTWDTDIPAVYTEDIYEYDNDGVAYTILDEGLPTERVELNLLHSMGEAILDGSGNPTYKHRAGEVIYHMVDNEWVPEEAVSALTSTRALVLPMLNAIYRFSDSDAVANYRSTVVDDIVGYLKEDIDTTYTGLIEQTDLFFAPANTFTHAKVYDASGNSVMMNTSIGFNIRIIMTRQGSSSNEDKEQARQACMLAIQEALSKDTISTSTLYREIMGRINDNVISIDIEDFLPAGGYAQLVNTYDSFSLRPRLYIRGDGSVDIEDDVTFEIARSN